MDKWINKEVDIIERIYSNKEMNAVSSHIMLCDMMDKWSSFTIYMYITQKAMALSDIEAA